MLQAAVLPLARLRLHRYRKSLTVDFSAAPTISHVTACIVRVGRTLLGLLGDPSSLATIARGPAGIAATTLPHSSHRRTVPYAPSAGLRSLHPGHVSLGSLLTLDAAHRPDSPQSSPVPASHGYIAPPPLPPPTMQTSRPRPHLPPPSMLAAIPRLHLRIGRLSRWREETKLSFFLSLPPCPHTCPPAAVA